MRELQAEVPRATLAALLSWSVARAIALVLIAEGIARLVVADGASAAADAGAIAAAGVLLRAGAAWATGVIGRRAAAAAKLRHRHDLVRAVVARRLDGGSVAALAGRGLDDLDGWFTGVLPATIAAVVVPLALGLRVASVDLLSAVVLAATLPLVPVFMVLIGLHSRDSVVGAQAALARLADHVAELAGGLPVLVGLGRDAEQTRRLDAIQRDHTRRTGRVLRTAFLSALALELLATISVALVAVVLGLRLLTGDVTLLDALVVLLLAPECFAALRELGAAHHAADDGRVALRRVRELVTGRAADGARPTTADRIGPDGPAGLRVRGLRVSYPSRRSAVVDGVGFAVAAGEIVALVGPSGAGKSTVLAAIAGVLPDDAAVEGAIEGTADGTDPTAIAWVPQDPCTVGATVRAELELATGDTAVDGVLGEVGLRDVAERDPALLSPGERRRLAVARALLRVDRGARVLLLDEPTAHLDAASADRVRAAIRRRADRAATVLVSHEQPTRAIADRVVAIGGATVVPDAAATGDAERIAAPVATTPASAIDAEVPDAAASAPPIAGVGRLVFRPLGDWIGAVLLATIAAGMGLALTAVSGWLIVRASEQPAIMYLLVAIVGVRFFGIGRAVARYAERLLTHRAAFRSTDALRLTLWRGIAARAAGSRRLLEGGRAVDYLVGTTGTVRDLLPRIVPPLTVAVLAVAGTVTAVALLAPAAAPTVAAVLLAALAVPAAVAGVAGAGAERRRITGGGRLLRGVAALGRASADLRGNGADERAIARVDDVAAGVAVAERRAAVAMEAGPLAAAAGAGAAAIAAGAQLAGAGTPTATVAVVVLLVLAVGDQLAAGAAAAQRIPALRTALGAVARLLGTPTAPDGGPLDAPRRIERVRIDGVSLAWPAADRPVATGIDADLRRGRWLAVTGPSGSGKTTLLTALLGGLAPSAGRILVDGVDLGRLRPESWRRAVAWCPQEAHVFDSTLRGNLALARPGAADDDLEAVLRRVGLGGLLDDLAAGLDAPVSRGGRALSGGERQRLAVARALLADAPIVLLDEPTAHLDADTATALLADLRRALADRLVVVVTHRAADLRPEDALLRLGADGQAVAMTMIGSVVGLDEPPSGSTVTPTVSPRSSEPASTTV